MNGVNIQPQNEQLPSFYWLPKLHKTPYSSAPLLCLLLVIKPYLPTLNSTVREYIHIQELTVIEKYEKHFPKCRRM